MKDERVGLSSSYLHPSSFILASSLLLAQIINPVN